MYGAIYLPLSYYLERWKCPTISYTKLLNHSFPKLVCMLILGAFAVVVVSLCFVNNLILLFSIVSKS